ncbi:MAG: hypothetical protein ABI647_06845, partial [Gemmatimonadota bacterium]
QVLQVKIYPPYPVDEPRRAAVIRQFNGVAAQIERELTGRLSPAAVSLPRLAPDAGAKEADQAAARLGETAKQIAASRTALAAGTVSQGIGDAEAQATSVVVKTGLAHEESGSITGRDVGVLRDIG